MPRHTLDICNAFTELQIAMIFVSENSAGIPISGTAAVCGLISGSEFVFCQAFYDEWCESWSMPLGFHSAWLTLNYISLIAFDCILVLPFECKRSFRCFTVKVVVEEGLQRVYFCASFSCKETSKKIRKAGNDGL